ncbi:OsmC family protein [Nonomuraea cavernae]|uniref:Peroxiredoxin n=1 Tax=Nonomuraea cavernae TaxID=2045107 RepID=A0A917ZCW1_9ACTN|nr:OsmC family protein [Nonomuraea cavernae]MCA2190275.1 OsmC family protein [Nonomuraea cavernae]GGO80483.1 peroxiredoxin [Nonomuraea cavernae]
MSREHRYHTTVTWTGNLGEGTSGYRTFSRDHEVSAEGKPAVHGSSDPAFRGDPARWNPEELLVASVSQCHMLWYLHLCATNGIVVTSYVDEAEGTMAEESGGAGRFTSVTLRPTVTIAAPEVHDKAVELHHEANRMCFVANSVNFPVRHEPRILHA